jgi:hypothetical protein
MLGGVPEDEGSGIQDERQGHAASDLPYLSGTVPDREEKADRFTLTSDVEVIDPRRSHRQLRCRRCGATWRPKRRTDGTYAAADLKCWRGCDSESGRSKE